MAFWDYHVTGGPSFVGLSDDRLSELRARYPKGRAVPSVHHVPRTPGDDETDHILRHRYGIDPAMYRGATVIPGRRVTDAELDAYEGRKASLRKRRASPRPRKPAIPNVRLSPLVQMGLREAPDSGATVARLVEKHRRGSKNPSRHSLFGMPLVITTTGKTIAVRFAMEGRK